MFSFLSNKTKVTKSKLAKPKLAKPKTAKSKTQVTKEEAARAKVAEVRLMKQNLGRVRLAYGRLMDQDGINTVVMSITDDMTLESPLNQTILEAAGPKLEDDILEHIYKPKPGDAYVFSGYQTGFTNIIVVVKPQAQNAELAEDRYLLRSYRSAMDAARKIGADKIAFPGMGVEYLRFPVTRAARLAVDGIVEKIYPEMQEVRIVCKDMELYQAFYDRLQKLGWSAQ